jgi:hypothetical protein
MSIVTNPVDFLFVSYVDIVHFYLSGLLFSFFAFIVATKWRHGVFYSKDFIRAALYAVLFSWIVVIWVLFGAVVIFVEWVSDKSFWNKKLF